MKIIKKLFRFISIGLLGILLVAVIWYSWPQKQEDSFLYLPENSLAYGQLRIDWREKGPAQLFDVLWQKMIAANPRLNNDLARKLVLSVLPQDILFSLTYNQEYVRLHKQPDYIMIINAGKKTRLVKLGVKIASYQGLGAGENKRLKIVNNLVIISSTDLDHRSLPATNITNLRALFKPNGREELNIYIPNKQRELSALIKLLEEENSFAFFPSIDSVDYVQISGNLVSADQFKGKMSFASKYIADVDKIGLDAFFLNNLLMRLLLGYGFTYEGEVSSLANFIEINYQAKGLQKYWQHMQ
jgi:hypothetical protein